MPRAAHGDAVRQSGRALPSVLVAATLAAAAVLAPAHAAQAQNRTAPTVTLQRVPGTQAGETVALSTTVVAAEPQDTLSVARLDFVPAMPAFAFGDEPGSHARTVTGAPYAADIVTTSTQTLADGNRIVHTQTTSIARDSQGRVRRDMAVTAIGSWMPKPEETPSWVTIEDPVAGYLYTLDAQRKTAMRRSLGAPAMFMTRSDAAGAPLGIAVPDDLAQSGHVDIVAGTAALGVIEPDEPALAPFARTVQLASVAGEPRADQAQTESLGKQTIEGVEAVGTRTTVTIPAGQIGNEQPILIVSERWYSSELQTTVLTKRDDPRMGVVVTRLTNVSRTEPAASLFEVPADYTLNTGIRRVKPQ